MDLRAVLAEVQSWTVEDQLRLVHELWDGLADRETEETLPDDLKELLERRLEALDRNTDAVLPWGAIEARAIERFRR